MSSKSELYKLAIAAPLATFNYLSTWQFWTTLVVTAWLIFTLIWIKVRKVSLHQNISPHSLLNLQNTSWFKSLCHRLKYGHIMISLYFIEDDTVLRFTRAVLFYCRLLGLLAFSAYFHDLAHGGAWWGTLRVMILPLGTVVPINLLLEFLLATKIKNNSSFTNLENPDVNQETEHLLKTEEWKRQKQLIIELIKKTIGYIFVAVLIVGYNYMVLSIAANTDSESSKSWAKTFLIALGWDLGVNQVIKVMFLKDFIKSMSAMAISAIEIPGSN